MKTSIPQSYNYKKCSWWLLNTLTNLVGPILTALLLSCREPVPGAGGHHPDQAERTHGGPAQSRRHRQHHHAGGHSLRNELLHRTVDPPQEIQTHHQHLLRRSSRSKSHTQNFLSTSKKTCLHTYKYLHTHLGQIKHWAGERSSRRERSSLFLHRQNAAGLFEEYFCTFCLVVSLLLFQFLSHLRFLNDAVVRRGERVWAEELGTFSTFVLEVQACHVSRKKKRRAVCIFLYECHICSLSSTFQNRIMVCDKKRERTIMTSHHRGDQKKNKRAVKMSSQCCQVLFGAFW